MLYIDKFGNIQMSVSHLVEREMETFDEIIERYNKLDITLFYPIVSSPNCRYERRFGEGRIPNDILKSNEKERFIKIISNKSIYGNPKGFFVNKQKFSLTPSQIDAIKSVSFALCDIDELNDHFEARGSEFGICFFHDFLSKNGITKVTYINNKSEEELDRLIFNSPHLLEVYSDSYDMRWENEWRIHDKLSFQYDDIAFVIVPDIYCDEISEWLVDEIDAIFPIIPSSAYKDSIDLLLMIPKLDNGWCQFKYRTKWGGKICMDFDEFPDLTLSDRIELRTKMGDALNCIPKSEIQGCYEDRYTKRFLKFLGQLRSYSLFDRLKNIEINAKETFYANVDLIRESYKALHDIQSDRIYVYDEDEFV